MTSPAPRDDMMIRDGLVYLNNASIGPLPRTSLEILNQYNTLQASIGEEKIDYDGIDRLWNSLRGKTATLLNCNKDGVTITKNTANGLHIVADLLFSKYKSGQNIVVPNIEFVTNSYVWQQVARRYGLELRLVYSQDGIIPMQEWERQVDDNTILVAVSFVQFSNGFKADIEAIATLAHNHGAYISVDAIQGLGVVPFDVESDDIDFVASAGYKWLLAPQGTGIFYVNPELLYDLDSVLVGWFSTPHYQELKYRNFESFQDARKFQLSMIDPTFHALEASLETILAWDVKHSNRQITGLLDYLVDEIHDLENYSIASSLKPKHRSTIVKIDTSFDPVAVVDSLRKRDITVSARGSGIRVSPHAYNTEEEIAVLIGTLRDIAIELQ